MASAVPLFNGLRHLPCPKEAGGARCTTTGCLFGHMADSQASKVPPPTFDGTSDENEYSNSSHEPPLKRQRRALGSPEEGNDARQASDTEGPSTTADAIASSDLYDPLSPPVVEKLEVIQKRKAVTQSPLKNEVPRPPRVGESLAQPSTPIKSSTPLTTTPVKPSPSESLNKASITELHSSSAIVQPTPTRPLESPQPSSSGTSATQQKAAPSSQAPTVPRKPETLNPRHLKAAPAAHGVRFKLLSMLHTDLVRLNREVSNRSLKDPPFKRFLLSDQELIWMALDREQEVATKRAAIYTNIMKQDVMKYKRMQFDAWVAERKQVLDKKAAPKNPSIGAPVTVKTGLTPNQEIQILSRLLTPVTDLDQYGYVPTVPTDDQISKAKEAVDMCAGWEKCDRCTARFQVFPGRNIETGELASGGKCTHHPGRLYFPERQKGDTSHIPKKYRCCNQDVGESAGCAVGPNHVWKTSDSKRLASLWNYAQTPANPGPVKKAVAFDCEMGYTVHGMELIRLTATSWPDGAEVLDILVQPFGEILDLNSRYSGVFPDDLARAVPWTADGKIPPQQPGERKILQKVSSPEVARDLFFSHISPETILVGHGLENDLNAMRMVHPRIVDTVLLYPHRRGLPIRMGLKALMEIHLNRLIQVDTGEGHDSAEDAKAAGDLVRLKVKKEWATMKSDGWKLVYGNLCEPGWKAAAKEQKDGKSVGEEEGVSFLTEDFLEAKS